MQGILRISIVLRRALAAVVFVFDGVTVIFYLPAVLFKFLFDFFNSSRSSRNITITEIQFVPATVTLQFVISPDNFNHIQFPPHNSQTYSNSSAAKSLPLVVEYWILNWYSNSRLSFRINIPLSPILGACPITEVSQCAYHSFVNTTT